MAVAHRTPPRLTPPFSLNLAPVDVNGKRGRAVGTTPPTRPTSTWFHLKLPPPCPPSPPLSQTVVSRIVKDTRAEWDLLFSLLRPDADKETTRLARETFSDTCDGPKALLRLMEFVQMSTVFSTEEFAHELGALTADLPMLFALPILLNEYVSTSERGGLRSVGSKLGLPENHYRLGCLTGFGRAKKYTAAVGQRVDRDLECQMCPTRALVLPCQ